MGGSQSGVPFPFGALGTFGNQAEAEHLEVRFFENFQL